jgi:hypothetical protein
VNIDAELDGEVPPGVVTVTETAPGALAGGLLTVTVLVVAWNPGAFTPPKATLMVPLKPDPEMVIGVPPLTGPDVGLRPEIAGTAR